jgi:hypothetical protein
VRKIISILVALGLILSLSIFTTPASAAVSAVSVSVTSTNCACQKGVYAITFTTTADLDGGWDTISIKFPAGTTIPATFATGDITCAPGGAVFGSEVEPVVDNTVTFKVPVDIGAGVITVTFTAANKLTNPCTPGQYQLEVKTSRAPDSAFVKSAAYTILPLYESYDFEVDFNPTYPGIAKNFVPPFKMCGQNSTGQNYTTVWNASIPGFLSVFNLSFFTSLPGCLLPCVNATIWFELTECPANEVITMGINGTWFTLTSLNKTVEKCTKGAEDPVVVENLTLSHGMNVTWNASLHFSSPGKYEICFAALCPEVTGCCGELEEDIAKRCYKFNVYQWKEAFKIPLCRKWNLISLPLVPLVDPPIEDVWAAYPKLDEVMSVWYCDRHAEDPPCIDGCDWKMWTPPTTDATDTLTTMEDGKSYWVRIAYNSTPGYGPGAPTAGLWVWGTVKPTPTSGPSAYPVCEGWNMIGYTELARLFDTQYLWNFVDASGPPHDFGAVYYWDACGCYTAPQSWVLLSYNLQKMRPGEGYWASFEANGTIFPP